MFELHRAEITQGEVLPGPIIKPFHLREDLCSRFPAHVALRTAEELRLERGEEGLDHGVVLAIAWATQ